MNSPQDFPPLFRSILRWLLEYLEINTNSDTDRSRGHILIGYATITVITALLALTAIGVLGFADRLPSEYRARSVVMILLAYLVSMSVLFPIIRAGKINLGTWLWLCATMLVPTGIVIKAPSVYGPSLPAILVVLGVLCGLILPWRQSLVTGLLLSITVPVISLMGPGIFPVSGNALITAFLIACVVSVVTLHSAIALTKPRVTPLDWLRDLESRSLGHRLDSLNSQIASRAHRIAQASGDNLSPACRSEVEEILRLSATIGEELDSAVDRVKLSQGEIVPSPGPIDPTHILHAVISRYNELALERRLRFRCFAHPFLPQEVRVDSLLLRRAIMNVVDNAIRFTDDGGEVGIEALHIDTRRWIVEVNDSGRGIADDTRTKIMHKLEKGEAIEDDAGEAKKGLSVAYNIVRILGGTMSIDSSEENGTTVTMILPVIQGESRL
jgi:signal transduction histidine kinase